MEATYFTAQRVGEILGKPVADIEGDLGLLRVTTSDNVTLYPSFQFRGGRVPEALVDLIKILGAHADGWTVATWLNARISRFDRATALDVVDSGDVDRLAELRDLALEDASGWRSW